MAKGILHLHITVVIVFIILLLIKTILLFFGFSGSLARLRAKTKIVEIVLGTLTLVTGGYLLYVTRDDAAYMVVKIILLFASVPLAFIGFKRNRKGLVLISLILLLYTLGIAFTRSLDFNIGKEKPETSLIQLQITDSSASQNIINQNIKNVASNAAPIFVQQCARCHGENGNLKSFGAKDLKQSKLSVNDKVMLISKGKNLMPGFQYQLSESDIQALALYTEKFK